jgi:hypothetical protein
MTSEERNAKLLGTCQAGVWLDTFMCKEKATCEVFIPHRGETHKLCDNHAKLAEDKGGIKGAKE